MYIPIRHYGGTDLRIAHGLSHLFRWYGWPSLAGRYVDQFQKTLIVFHFLISIPLQAITGPFSLVSHILIRQAQFKINSPSKIQTAESQKSNQKKQYSIYHTFVSSVKRIEKNIPKTNTSLDHILPPFAHKTNNQHLKVPAKTSPKRSVDIHTYIGLSYTKEGPYVTIYYNIMIFSTRDGRYKDGKINRTGAARRRQHFVD